MHVSRLFVYPVKSAAGIEVQAADIDDFGFHLDRRWMFVRNGSFVTQREDARLTRVRPKFSDGGVSISAEGMPELVLPTFDRSTMQAPIWDDIVGVHDCGDDVADWLTTLLGEATRLVFLPDSSFRRIDPRYSPDERRVSLADGYPFLLVSDASVQEICRRTGLELSVRRFRPNIVVGGAPYPHAEDDWRRITIADQTFSIVKPCARCVVTTIDPDTGIAGPEPLRTLATYRKVGSKVMFAQNMIHDAPGRIAVGDAIAVVEGKPRDPSA